MAADTPIDRHDLEGLKEWIRSEFRAVDIRLNLMNDAVRLASREQERKDEQLNDVRLRFIPREVFEQYKEAQATKMRALLTTIVLEGITLVSLGLISVFNYLARMT